MCHLRDDDFQDKKETVSIVDKSQEAINNVAIEIMAMSEMDLFKGWLQVRQDVAQRGMKTTEGDVFIDHSVDFTMFMDARQVVFMYEREARG